MLKFCYGLLTVATIAIAVGPASSQQPATTPAPAAAPADTGQSGAPAGAFSYFVNIRDGDAVTSPFKVVFGLSPNMGVAPAGVDKKNVGHHHLLVDKTLTPEEMTQPIVADGQHIHFGKGQTETTVTLPPGKHTLQLVLANWSHIPFKPPVQSEVITVTVKAEAAEKPAAAAPPTDAKQDAKEKAPATMKDATVNDAKPKPRHHGHHHRRHHHRHDDMRSQYLHT
jgi:hypothetical protein